MRGAGEASCQLKSEYEKNIKEKGLVPGGFDQNKGRQTVHFSLVNPLEENPNKK